MHYIIIVALVLIIVILTYLLWKKQSSATAAPVVDLSVLQSRMPIDDIRATPQVATPPLISPAASAVEANDMIQLINAWSSGDHTATENMATTLAAKYERPVDVFGSLLGEVSDYLQGDRSVSNQALIGSCLNIFKHVDIATPITDNDILDGDLLASALNVPIYRATLVGMAEIIRKMSLPLARVPVAQTKYKIIGSIFQSYEGEPILSFDSDIYYRANVRQFLNQISAAFNVDLFTAAQADNFSVPTNSEIANYLLNRDSSGGITLVAADSPIAKCQAIIDKFADDAFEQIKPSAIPASQPMKPSTAASNIKK